jgi:hypothetical protein
LFRRHAGDETIARAKKPFFALGAELGKQGERYQGRNQRR